MTSRSYIFTINNPKTTLTFPEDKVKYASWQKEKGDVGTEHYQGYMELSGPARISAIKNWGGEWERAHLEKRAGTPEQARNYTRKEESRVDGPWEFGSWEDQGQGKRSDLRKVSERLEEGASIEDVAKEHPESYIKYHKGIKRLADVYERGRVNELPAVLKEWQQNIIDIIREPPHPRTVHWIVDIEGGAGKTFLGEYMERNYGAFILNGGKHDRMLHMVGERKPRIVIFDFSRTMVRGDNDHVPYGVIESVKNGYVASGFYGEQPVRWDKPHVICFANFEPDRTGISQDRWNIVYL